MLVVHLREYFCGSVTAVEIPFRVSLVDTETGDTLNLPLGGIIDLIEENDTISELKTTRCSVHLKQTPSMRLNAGVYGIRSSFEDAVSRLVGGGTTK